MLFKKHLYFKQTFLKYLANIIAELHKTYFEKIELHITKKRNKKAYKHQSRLKRSTNFITKLYSLRKYYNNSRITKNETRSHSSISDSHLSNYWSLNCKHHRSTNGDLQSNGKRKIGKIRKQIHTKI